MTQARSAAPNLFYVTPAAAPSAKRCDSAGDASYVGAANPCAQPQRGLQRQRCASTSSQIFAVANSGSNDTVTLYVNGQTLPLATMQSGVVNPQALVFDGAGDLFVANQPGSVTVYAPPYNQSPAAIATGVNHPQALAIDARGNLFVANGNGSNTVTVYSPPYGGTRRLTISARTSTIP